MDDKSRNRRSKVVLHIDGNGVNQAGAEPVSNLRLRGRPTCACYFLNVAVVCAATTSQHVDVRVVSPQIAILHAKFKRIAVIEGGCLIEFRMAQPRSIGADAP